MFGGGSGGGGGNGWPIGNGTVVGCVSGKKGGSRAGGGYAMGGYC